MKNLNLIKNENFCEYLQNNKECNFTINVEKEITFGKEIVIPKGEYRFCVTKEDEDEWLVCKYSGKHEMYREPIGKVTKICNRFYYTRRLGLTAELKFLDHPFILLGLLNNEIYDLSSVKVYKHTRCKYCRTWVRAVSSIKREAGPCCYRRNS